MLTYLQLNVSPNSIKRSYYHRIWSVWYLELLGNQKENDELNMYHLCDRGHHNLLLDNWHRRFWWTVRAVKAAAVPTATTMLNAFDLLVPMTCSCYYANCYCCCCCDGCYYCYDYDVNCCCWWDWMSCLWYLHCRHRCCCCLSCVVAFRQHFPFPVHAICFD